MAVVNTSFMLLSEKTFVIQNSNLSLVSDKNQLSWTAVPIIFIAIFSAGIVTNGSVLVVLLLNQRLRPSSFNLYLMNLLSTNLLYFIIQAPLDILNDLYPHWWLGERWCTVYVYAANALGQVLMNNHALIALNRIWALALPISYKNHHTKLVAALNCLAVWVCSHLLTMPGIVLDALYNRRPSEIYGCYVDPEPQFTWAILTQFVASFVPECVVLAAFPFLWYKQNQRTKSIMRKKKVIVQLAVLNAFAGHSQTSTKSINKENSRFFKGGKSEEAFLTLTLLTGTVVVCWTPVTAYYTIVLFTKMALPVFSRIAAVLFALAPLLDPIYFSVSSRDLRLAFLKLFGNPSATFDRAMTMLTGSRAQSLRPVVPNGTSASLTDKTGN